MKNKKPIKWLTAGLLVMLLLGAFQKASGQDTTLFNISRSIQSSCSSCAAGDSLDLNDDNITDLYIKIQQWTISYGPHHSIANALLIWGAAGDSVAGGCLGGGYSDNLIEGDTIDSGTNWSKLVHPFYIEPGMPWVCDCNCSSEKTTYIAVRFRISNNDIKYGWIKVDYTATGYSIDYGLYMNNGAPIIINEY
jgi:hypothetical protein